MAEFTLQDRPTFKVAHWYRCHGLVDRDNFLAFEKTFGEIINSLSTTQGDALWNYVRSLFDYDDYADCVPINAANLSILFHPVQVFLNCIGMDWNKDISIQKRIKPFVHTIQIARALIAKQLKVEPKLVAFLRNGSDPNAVISNGLDFAPGEEVLVWNQNHPTGGEVAWKIRQKRFKNINIRVLDLKGETDPTKIVAKFLGQVNEKTKLVAFSEIDAESGRFFTFSQLKDQTYRFSYGLAKRGFKQGDVMAMYLPNVIEYPIIFFGTAIIGGIITTVNPKSSHEDLAHYLQLSHAKYLVTTPSLAEKAFSAGVLKGMRSVFVIGQAEDCESISSLLFEDGAASTYLDDVKIDPKEDVVALPFSSGTTGVSKGVMLTHYNLIAQIRVLFGDARPERDAGGVLSVLPLYHIYGLTVIMAGRLHIGSKIVLLSRFEPNAFLRAIQDYKVTSTPLVPPLVSFLVKHPLVDKFDLSSLKSVSSGAAPLPQELATGVAKRIPSVGNVKQGFGMTELSGGSHFPVPPDGKDVLGSIGVLLPNLECKIIDLDTGITLGSNQDGEMCIRGPTVMKGYLDNPEATAQTIDSEGWLHTGDIAHYDEDEYFFIVGRLKELIKYKGFQVPPAELEEVLITHPNVDDVAVIGVPDDEAGELPKAFVVRRGNVTAEEIEEFVAAKVSPHKKLRGGVEFVDQIPKSPSGKMLRRLLNRKACPW